MSDPGSERREGTDDEDAAWMGEERDVRDEGEGDKIWGGGMTGKPEDGASKDGSSSLAEDLEAIHPHGRSLSVPSSSLRPFEPFPLPPRGATTQVDSHPRKGRKAEYDSAEEAEVDSLTVKEFDWEGVMARAEKEQTRHLMGHQQVVDEEKAEIFRQTALPDGFELDDTPLLVKAQTCWYPGVLHEFQPAKDIESQRRPGDLYVCRMRGESGTLRRRRKDVCFLDDDRIATVVLGEYKVSHAQTMCDANTRAVTPPADQSEAGPSRTPMALDCFAELQLAQQLYQIRPHLMLIIRDDYAPGKWRADYFFGPRSQRDVLGRKMQLGDIHPDQVENIIVPELRRWALRGDRKGGQAAHPGDPPEPPRPTGSARYESLSMASRERYVMDVLLPEAVVRLCICTYGSDYLLSKMAQVASGNRSPDAGIVSIVDSMFDTANPDAEQEPTGIPADDEVRLYAAARDRLLELRCADEEREWEIRDDHVKAKRAAARRRLRLPAEGLSEWEKKKVRVASGDEEGRVGGRLRTKVNYKET